jgi:DsbC/DsbD-like thiol-disulfide interchange protein
MGRFVDPCKVGPCKGATMHSAKRWTKPLLLIGAGLALVSTLSGGASQAQPTAVPHARVSLVSSVENFVPGQPFTVAVFFEMDPDWHVYFKDPGESGMPPEVQWSLPEGLTAGELQFPIPEVLKTPAGVNFVYHDKVAFLVEMTPGANFQLGRSVEIEARVSWLECDADTCLPAKGAAKVAVTPQERQKLINQDQFDTWRAKVKEAESFDPDAARKS